VALKTILDSRPKWTKSAPVRPKNHTLWDGTYLIWLVVPAEVGNSAAIKKHAPFTSEVTRIQWTVTTDNTRDKRSKTCITGVNVKTIRISDPRSEIIRILIHQRYRWILVQMGFSSVPVQHRRFLGLHHVFLRGSLQNNAPLVTCAGSQTHQLTGATNDLFLYCSKEQNVNEDKTSPRIF